MLLITAHGTILDAVAATQSGAFDFLTKPVNSKLLLERIEKALSIWGGDGDQADEDWRSDIISRSPLMEALLSQARRIADADASVLITGDSGTGKELLARAIHRASARGGHEFVAINCGAIPEPLLESELFGHERGAFTGAVREHRGLFQAASNGTLFLDEIGDMPLAL
ncbi:MAG: sigma 54-interacting transcriptional regulator [Gammaproteobacteria bacterium]